MGKSTHNIRTIMAGFSTLREQRLRDAWDAKGPGEPLFIRLRDGTVPYLVLGYAHGMYRIKSEMTGRIFDRHEDDIIVVLGDNRPDRSDEVRVTAADMVNDLNAESIRGDHCAWDLLRVATAIASD